VLAEDLLQETWMRLAQHVPTLKEDTALGAWLFTVASNLARSQRRWQLVDLQRLQHLLFRPRGAPVTPLEAMAASEEQRALERALAALSTSDRELLLLVGVESFTPSQAAAVLGLRPDAVRQRLLRARARLASLLGEQPSTPSANATGGQR
jgi:RNA polymerase sigma-70 factor (ECF subfamily)